MKNIKELIKKILLSLNVLFKKIKGKDVADPPVLAGLDAKIIVDGKTIGWATNVSFDEDFELQGIRTLGYHGDRGYKSQGYNCTVTIGTFVLQSDQTDSLPLPTRETILTSGMVSFEIIDIVTGKTLYILDQCKCATKGVTLDSGTLAAKNTTWRCRRVIPKAETSL